MIPKVIHYCWFGGKPFSPMVEKCIDSWKENLPDYQIKRWDENNSPITQCSFAKGSFRAKRWAFVADYVRCYALFHEGGIYMDTDMLVLKSFDPLLHHRCFLGLEKISTANGAIIGAVRQHRFIQEILEHFESHPFDTKAPVLIPRIMTDILIEKGMTDEDSLQEIFDVHIYSTDYFYPYPFDIHRQHLLGGGTSPDYMSYVTANSFAVHLWNWSWKKAPVVPWYTPYLKRCPNFIKLGIKSLLRYKK